MKKIIYLILVVGLVFTGCNPNEDINEDIDAQANPVVGNTEYTLTDDDYDDLDLGFGSFNSVDQAKDSIPQLLEEKYPYWGEGSSVLTNYNLYIGNAFDIRDYNLDQADYTFSGSDGLGFNSDDNPQDYLADILADNIDNPSEGDYRRAKYFQYTGDFVIVTPTVSLEDNFDYGSTAGDLTAVSSGSWEAHSGEGNGPIGYDTSSLSMDDYPSTDVGGSLTIDGEASEDVTNWFSEMSSGNVYASALVNFSAVGEGTYVFHLRDTDFAVGYVARVGAKDDGSGNILFGIGASSSSLTYGTTAFNLNTTYLVVSSYNIETGLSNLYVLSAAETTEPTTPEATSSGDSGAIITGVSIRQGFGGPTGTLDGVRVSNTWSAIMSNDELEDEIVGDRTAGEMYYEYTGEEWALPSSDFYAITDEDFASMGIESFGSSTPADNYLPVFLGLKYPFAQEDDTINVGYNYVSSSSGPGARGNLYTFANGVWTAYESTIETSLQFGYNDGDWVPDNTIRYTLVGGDYAAVVAALADVDGFVDAVANLDSFGNFNRTSGNWTDDMLVTALDVVLDNLDPNAEELQKYVLTIATWAPGNSTEEWAMIKNEGEWVTQASLEE